MKPPNAPPRAPFRAVITGTGRSGTTYLHTVLHRLGVSPHCVEVTNPSDARPLAEKWPEDPILRHPDFVRTWPRMTPPQRARVLEAVHLVILCVRDLGETSRSWSKRTGHRFPGAEAMPERIEPMLAEELGCFIAWLGGTDIPLTMVDFARRKDPEYLYRALGPLWVLMRGRIPLPSPEIFGATVERVANGPKVS